MDCGVFTFYQKMKLCFSLIERLISALTRRFSKDMFLLKNETLAVILLPTTACRAGICREGNADSFHFLEVHPLVNQPWIDEDVRRIDPIAVIHKFTKDFFAAIHCKCDFSVFPGQFCRVGIVKSNLPAKIRNRHRNNIVVFLFCWVFA